jgi:hypothetical protein
MNRGGRSRIARRLMAAGVMLGLGIAVVGGGVAFADDTAGSGTPASTVPGVVSDYQVDTPSIWFVPVDPGTPIAPIAPGGGGMATANDWDWS